MTRAPNGSIANRTGFAIAVSASYIQCLDWPTGEATVMTLSSLFLHSVLWMSNCPIMYSEMYVFEVAKAVNVCEGEQEMVCLRSPESLLLLS